ncbi:hypothetical protein I302_101268 [Kwoniella bestiolae CBS 10118]|uniref:Uncharacterized protein n=1 Tax=Kwoniella bestiolae CBS 10118 TaxID=1296100 RepID=A0A1B9G7H6_9TREE|nr:hypothetical protein I302_04642 [Kwoniella bestiolae CBS 10118]OCF26951.1 hypothetical protein I302_04642 [Kwoniella bestiolae CBS 10118]
MDEMDDIQWEGTEISCQLLKFIGSTDQWQKNSEQSWYFKYLELKLRFHPYWLRPDDNHIQKSLAKRTSAGPRLGPTLPFGSPSSSPFRRGVKHNRTSRLNSSRPSVVTESQRQLPLPVVRLPPVVTEHLEAVHQQEEQESILDDAVEEVNEEVDDQGFPSVSGDAGSDSPDDSSNTEVPQIIENDSRSLPLVFGTININDNNNEPPEVEELSSPLSTSSLTSATMVNTSPHAINQDQDAADVAPTPSVGSNQNEKLVLVLLDMIIQEREIV